jgi:hypothetical protein
MNSREVPKRKDQNTLKVHPIYQNTIGLLVKLPNTLGLLVKLLTYAFEVGMGFSWAFLGFSDFELFQF